ncbi:MAG TPA: hypothetical protein VMX11_01030 [Actinomycetes bacterium]|nr:hypothetical protein [Actinomycetes bacterium]
MTEQDTARSYDDLPESDVATVLQVPLLLIPGTSDAQAPPSGRSGRRASGRQPGRHRAPATPDHRPRRPLRSSSTSRPRRTPPRHDPLVVAAKVGLVSAALVLMVFAAVLLALAAWLP